MTGLLAVEALHVQLGRVHAVRGISFTLAAGETLCIVGESGCGKSTAALALMGLLPEDTECFAHRLAFEGRDLRALSDTAMSDLRGDRIAMVFQEPANALNPAYTIGDQLGEAWLRHRGGGRTEARTRALDLLRRVGVTGLPDRLGQYPHQLSGGLCQRVMIAMALICGPRLLIADEPTTALDVTIQAQVLRLLRALQAEFELGILLITHNLGVVSRVADRVAVMYAGTFMETAPARALFRAPMHPYTRGLLAALPTPGAKSGARLAAIGGAVPDLTQPLTGCAFRTRCPHARAACAAPEIPEFEPAPGHRYRCVRPPEEAAS